MPALLFYTEPNNTGIILLQCVWFNIVFRLSKRCLACNSLCCILLFHFFVNLALLIPPMWRKAAVFMNQQNHNGVSSNRSLPQIKRERVFSILACVYFPNSISLWAANSAAQVIPTIWSIFLVFFTHSWSSVLYMLHFFLSLWGTLCSCTLCTLYKKALLS